jgi:hypothetical protein
VKTLRLGLAAAALKQRAERLSRLAQERAIPARRGAAPFVLQLSGGASDSVAIGARE